MSEPPPPPPHPWQPPDPLSPHVLVNHVRHVPPAQLATQPEVLSPLTIPTPSNDFDVCTGNLNGPIVLERFKLYLSALPTAHKVLLLTEFKLGEGATIERYKQAAHQYHYHLLASPGSPTGGVAIMVHHSVARDPPKLEVVVPARLAYVSLNVHPDPDAPPLKLVVFYGSTVGKERSVLVRPLEKLLKEPCLIGGDFNATTLDSDSTALTSNHWAWLQGQEKSGSMVDTIRLLVDPPPIHTREGL